MFVGKISHNLLVILNETRTFFFLAQKMKDGSLKGIKQKVASYCQAPKCYKMLQKYPTILRKLLFSLFIAFQEEYSD